MLILDQVAAVSAVLFTISYSFSSSLLCCYYTVSVFKKSARSSFTCLIVCVFVCDTDQARPVLALRLDSVTTHDHQRPNHIKHTCC